MNALTNQAIAWVERDRVPDTLIRLAIRRLLGSRLRELAVDDGETFVPQKSHFVEAMRDAPIAVVPELANEQHYEVPAAFFAEVLGARRKYSGCYWGAGARTLDEAENAALRLTCERLGIEDGQRVLDLGCGWGSLSLWIAEHYPNCQVTGVSNSQSQRREIESGAAALGLDNVRILTRDMNAFTIEESFDRVVSVEMFEHMRNWGALFERIARWLAPDGRFLLHVFTHRLAPYLFLDRGPGDWMSRHFFSGGMMPSEDLPLWFQRNLRVLRQWRWDGRHYEKTANAWLANMDARADRIAPILSETYGSASADLWRVRWRLFFMACAELFGYRRGQEWGVTHYLLERQR